MANKNTCLLCGSRELVDGRLLSTGRVYFRPQHAKFISLRVADLAVKTYMCSACGAITLRGDVEKLHRLRPELVT